MKTYYVGDRIEERMLCVFGFVQKSKYKRNSDIFTNPDTNVKVIVSKTTKREPVIIKIIGAKYLMYMRNDT